MDNKLQRKVSPEQIQKLFRFMTKKYVRYYDVQIELVDHFASAIETMWVDEPNMPFEQGISRVYSQFPITGFHVLIEEKTKAIKLKLRRIFWRSFKELASIEAACVVIAFVYSMSYFLFSIPYASIVAFSLFLVLWILGFFMNFNFYKTHKKNKNRFLVLDVSFTILGSFIMFPAYFLNQIIPNLTGGVSLPIACIYSVLIVIVGIFIILQYKTLQDILDEWKHQYAFIA